MTLLIMTVTIWIVFGVLSRGFYIAYLSGEDIEPYASASWFFFLIGPLGCLTACICSQGFKHGWRWRPRKKVIGAAPPMDWRINGLPDSMASIIYEKNRLIENALQARSESSRDFEKDPPPPMGWL